MTFLSTYGFLIAVFLLSFGLVTGGSYVLSHVGKVVTSWALGLTGAGVLLYGWLVPEEPFAGIAYGALAFCIVLGISISWAFIDFKNDENP
ncbi:hypothetical protein [uncultured Marinococcus sp.]|uniref:hypothetical protein n=1 Tax=uncultured Marinococcus sp. TaxID=487012 RepID=UPI00261E3241|nr:hypothetical protein [uncultured Marinococcus sp.]